MEQFGRPTRGSDDPPSSSYSSVWETDSSAAHINAEEASIASNKFTKIWFDSTDRAEYATHKSLSVSRTDLVVDLPDLNTDPLFATKRSELSGKSYSAAVGLSVWPKDFTSLLKLVRDCPPFSFRLDALRKKQSWCSGI